MKNIELRKKNMTSTINKANESPRMRVLQQAQEQKDIMS